MNKNKEIEERIETLEKAVVILINKEQQKNKTKKQNKQTKTENVYTNG